MKLNYTICAVLVFTLLFNTGKGQDIHFSQLSETPLYLNPANTGFFNGYFRGVINYRNQWAAMNNAYQTMGVSVDGGLFRSKKRSAYMGLGMTIFKDQAGAAKLSTTSALLNASAIVKVGRGSAFSLGLAFGSVSTNADYSKLRYESQFNGNSFDESTVSGEIPYRQYTTLDLGFGMAYEISKVKYDQDYNDATSVKFGIGAFHLNTPTQEYGAGSKFELPVRMVYSIQSNIDLEDTRFSLTPMFVYQTQGKNQNLIFGSDIKFRMKTGTKITSKRSQNSLGFGLYYRRKDAIAARLIADIGNFSVGISNDFNISGYRAATNVSGGGLEISLRYNMMASALFDAKREYR
ncbi:MAG TPA: PorP/SprF family type IX secretion system membrane protein [Bacteroidia bacterium]|nr:PorP/SprF family type IX secretion system membrane protein [Bacteroidia bacterium]